MTELETIKENLYTPECIRTFSGIYMNVFSPTEDMLSIEDIAHALSNQCRFGGHLPRYYSVAQHSIHCSEMAPKDLRLQALMHDSAEAYLIDLPRPIKHNIKGYREIEDNLMEMIAKKYQFEWPLNNYVKKVDEDMLNIEWQNLMLEDNDMMERMSPEKAKKEFLKLFYQLTQ